MKAPVVILFLLRLAVGLIFLVSGAQKIILPVENFQYVIQGYEVLHNDFLERASALIVPWMEYLAGGFLILGLWTRFAASVIWLLNTAFIIFVSQAIMRGLDLSECGCFGDMMSFSLPKVLSLDVAVWFALAAMMYFQPKTDSWSLDRRYS